MSSSIRYEANAPFHHIQLDSFHDYLAQKYHNETISRRPRTETHPFSFSFLGAIVSKLSITLLISPSFVCVCLCVDFYSGLTCVTYRNFRILSSSLFFSLTFITLLSSFDPFILSAYVWSACKPYRKGALIVVS